MPLKREVNVKVNGKNKLMLNVKQWIPTFKVFWSDSSREWNPGLPTTRQKLNH